MSNKWLNSLVFTASSQWRNSQICVPWSCLGGACSERDVIGQCSLHSSCSNSCHFRGTEASVHYKHPADDLRHFSACCSRYDCYPIFCRVASKIKHFFFLMVGVFMYTSRFSVWPPLRSASRVWNLLFSNTPATGHWLPGCLWAFTRQH